MKWQNTKSELINTCINLIQSQDAASLFFFFHLNFCLGNKFYKLNNKQIKTKKHWHIGKLSLSVSFSGAKPHSSHSNESSA
jgi:hypothetical protein